MPLHGTPSEFGELRVRLAIVMPDRLTPEERAFAQSHFEPRAERAPGEAG